MKFAPVFALSLVSLVFACADPPVELEDGVDDDSFGAGKGDGSSTPPACPLLSGAFSGGKIYESPDIYNALLQPDVGEATPRIVYNYDNILNPYVGATITTPMSGGPSSTGYVSTDKSREHFSIATVPGAETCVAWIDRFASLHLTCTTFGDRILAPHMRKATLGDASLAMARHASDFQVLFVDSRPNQTSRLMWMPYSQEAANGAVPPGPAEEVAGTGVRATWLAIDSSGRPHVAFTQITAGNVLVRYATRSATGWNVRTIAQEPTHDNPMPVSLALVDDGPVIAFYRHQTRSLVYATQRANGTFAVATLVAPPAGFPGDSAGRAVALHADACDQVHAVYMRRFTTDPQPGQLVYGLVANGTISYSPLPDSWEYGRSWQNAQPHAARDLSLHVDGSGHAYVAAMSWRNDKIYFAKR